MKHVDTLVKFGSAVRKVGNLRVGGHAMLFNTAAEPDLYQTYFDASTDYDLEDGDRRSGYYNHGMDLKLANRKIGTGTIRKDDLGLWLEAQLDERNEYSEMIMQLVEDGKLGFSTGALSHLVRMAPVDGNEAVSHVTHWPVGEWSLTPCPGDPRNCAIPLRSLARSQRAAPVRTYFSEYVYPQLSLNCLQSLTDALYSAVANVLYDWDEQMDAAAQSDAVEGIFAEFGEIGLTTLKALVMRDGTRSVAEAMRAIWKQPVTASEVAAAAETEKRYRELSRRARMLNLLVK